MTRWYIDIEYNRDKVDQVPKESFMVHNLKTLRGIKKRYFQNIENIKNYTIKKCNSEYYYNENNWITVETYQKDHGIALTTTTIVNKKEAI